MSGYQKIIQDTDRESLEEKIPPAFPFASKKTQLLDANSLQKADKSFFSSKVLGLFNQIKHGLYFIKKRGGTECKKVQRYFGAHSQTYRLKRAFAKGTGQLAQKESLDRDNPIVQLEAQLSMEQVIEVNSEDRSAHVAYLGDQLDMEPIDRELFAALFSEQAGLCLDPDHMHKILSQAGLSESFHERVLKPLEQAIDWEHVFRSHVLKEKGTLAEKKEMLLVFAKQTQRAIDQLNPGTLYFLFGGVDSRNANLIQKGLLQHMPKPVSDLLSTDDIETTCQEHIESGKNYLRAKWGTTATDRKHCALPEQALSALSKKKVDRIKNSLGKKGKKLFARLMNEEQASSLGAKIWEKLQEEKVEKTIQDILLDACKHVRSEFDKRVAKINHEVISSTAEGGPHILSALGLLKSEEKVCFAFEKQKNGKFRLALFAEGLSTSFHPQQQREEKKGALLPLVYSDIDLDLSLFYALFSYRAMPKWDANASFDIGQMYEGLIASLQKEPDEATPNTFVPLEELKNETAWKQIIRYFQPDEYVDADQLNLLFYELRVKAFAKMWAEREEEMPEGGSYKQLKSAFSMLTKQGIELYQNKRLSKEKLQALHATALEVNEVLFAASPPKSPINSVVVPPIMQKMLKNFLLEQEALPEHIELIKQIAEDVYGLQAKEIVEQTVLDLFPDLTSDELNKQFMHRGQISSRLTRVFSCLKNFHLSALDLTSLYVDVSKIVCEMVSAAIFAKLIELLILTAFPHIMEYHPMISVAVVAKALVCFGPILLKPVLPHALYEPFSAAYQLTKEACFYVQSRLTALILGKIVRIAIGKKRLAKLFAQARNVHQQMTRSGELSYTISHDGNEKKEYFKVRPVESFIMVEADKTPCPHRQKATLPTPSATDISEYELEQELCSWEKNADRIRKKTEDQEVGKARAIFYLNRQFRNLPLPSQTTMWDQIDPLHAMRLLERASLCMSFATSSAHYHFSSDEFVETATTLYTIYAIMDHLARRIPDAWAEGERLKANGCDLALCMQSSAISVIREDTRKQLRETLAYFGFRIAKKYSEQEIDQCRMECFFHYARESKKWFTSLGFKSSEDQWTAHHTGFWYSKEGKYYRRLLQTPKIQKALRQAKISEQASDWEKFNILFASARTMLPEPFAMLLEIDQRSRYWLKETKGMTHSFQVAPSDRGSIHPMIDRVCHSFHRYTWDMFRQQTFNVESGKGFFPIDLDQLRCDEITRKTSQRGREQLGRLPQITWSDSLTLKQLFHDKNVRPVNLVMTQDPLHILGVSEYEARLLELINHGEQEELIEQVIGFFNINIDRLRQPRFQLLFSLHINRLSISFSHKTVPRAIAHFFEKALDRFGHKVEELSICLFVTEMGQIIEQFFSPQQRGALPDFRAHLRDVVLPKLKDAPPSDRLLVYQHLAFSHGFKTAREMTLREKECAIKDIAPLVCTLIQDRSDTCSVDTKSTLMLRVDETLFIWKPYVINAMEKDPAFRKECIERALRDAGEEWTFEKGDKWRGTYPIFTNGQLSFDCEQKTCSHYISMDMARKKGKEVGLQLGKGIGLGNNSFFFPNYNITVTFVGEICERGVAATIYRDLGEKKYEYLPFDRLEFLTSSKPLDLEKKDILWLEQTSKLNRELLCMQGEKEKWKWYVEQTEGENGKPIFRLSYQCYDMQKVLVRQVDLFVESHGLALLTWFTDLSEIKAYAKIAEPDQIAFIKLPKWGLSFEIKKHRGQLQALALEGPPGPGYFISKKQRYQPLLPYGKYLLMENDFGDKKVCILTQPMYHLMIHFFTHSADRPQLSPLVDSYIESLGAHMSGAESQLLTFDLDSKGNLSSSDPVGIAYLALFHLVRKENEKSLRYFCMIEEYGKKHPFPQAIFSIFEMMYFPLLLSQGRFSSEMALRLGVMQSENRLIQRGPTHELLPKHLKFITGVRWALLQVKYKKYLETMQAAGGDFVPILTDFEELFLLMEMGKENQRFFQTAFHASNRSDSLLNEWRKIGLEAPLCIAKSFLFSPLVAKRYHELRLQLDTDRGVTKELTDGARGLMIQAINHAFISKSSDQSHLAKGLDALFRGVEKAKQSALFQLALSRFFRTNIIDGAPFAPLFYQQAVLDLDLSQLPTAIWDFDQNNLMRYFPLYYRLVKNEPRPNADQTLFKNKREELIKTLALARGYVSFEMSLLWEALELVARETNSFPFVSANDLENAIIEEREKKSEFSTFLINRFLPPLCAFYQKQWASNIKARVWSGAKKGLDVAMFWTPGFLLPPTLAAAQCVYQTKSFVSSALNGDTNLLNRGMCLAAKVGGLALGVVCPEYYLATCFLQTVPYLPKLWTLKRSIELESVKSREPSDLVTSKSRSKLGQEPLESEMITLLRWRSHQIDSAFDQLVDEFFDSKEIKWPIASMQVERYQTALGDANLQRAFTQINQELDEYYKRTEETRLKVRIKKGKNENLFVERVRELAQEMACFIEKEEKGITAWTNRKRNMQNESDPEGILKRGWKCSKEPLIFREIYTLFTKADDESFIKKVGIDPENFRDLKKRLYLYQIVRRRFNLLFNLVEQNAPAHMLALELKRRAAYEIDQKVSELVLRAKLSYEIALEFMLYQTDLQSDQLDRLLLEEGKKAVSEQIMGTGKTFLLPISDHVFADGKTLVCNTVISSVAPSHFNFFISSTKKSFDQNGTILRFDRLKRQTTEQLQALTLLLKKSIYLGEYVNATQKDWQALDLMRLEECLDEKGHFLKKYGAQEWELRQQYYKECIDLLEQYGLENSDEKHKLDEPNKNILNFPAGQALVLEKEQVYIISEIMLFLVTAPDFKNYITIKAKRPEKLNVETYRAHIKKPLADWIAALDYFNIHKEEQEIFSAYLRGELQSIPDFVKEHPNRRAIGQAKGCVTILLENALSSVINVDFTVSQKKQWEEFTRPAEGNTSPLEDSKDLKPDINYIKTVMRLLQNRLSNKQLKKLLKYLVEKAKKGGERSAISPTQTPEGKFFAQHCHAFQIDTFRPSDQAEIFSLLHRSDRAVVLYAKVFIAPQIKFFPSFLSSNFANFHSLFGKGERSRTGTPNNQRNYSPHTQILRHPGTLGESVHVLEKKVGADSIHVLDASDPEPALKEMIFRFFHADCKMLAFIDLDPICNNMNGEMICSLFQFYMQDKRPHLGGIVFFDRDKNLVIAEKGSQTPIPFERSVIPKKDRISIFSQTQTTGSDIPQIEEAKAVLTVGENITLTNLAQAFNRMRGVRRGKQQVIVVMTKKAQEKISARLQIDAEHVPNMREIIQLAAANEEEHLDSEYYLAARFHLHDIVRKAFDKKGRNQPTVSKMVEVMRKNRDIFLVKNITDPFEAYGGIDLDVDPTCALIRYKECLFEKIRKNGLFSPTEIEQIKKRLDAVALDRAKKNVHMYKGQEHREQSPILLDQSVYQIEESENGIASETNIDLNQDVTLQLQKQLADPSKVLPKQKPHYGYPWPDRLDPYDIDQYFQIGRPTDRSISSSVPIYSMRSLLQTRKNLAYLEKSISNSLFVSENFAQQKDNRWVFRAHAIEPFGANQPPLYQALVIQDRTKACPDLKILLLHKEEIPFWKKKLHKERRAHPKIQVALYDFWNRDFSVGDFIEPTPEFFYAVTQARFFNVELEYDQEEKKALLTWIDLLGRRGAAHLRQTFEMLHHQRKMGSYEGSGIQTLFLDLSDTPLDMGIKV